MTDDCRHACHEKPGRAQRAQSGSVFTTLMAGAAFIGALGYMTFQTMSGPVATMQRATARATADAQMSTIARLIISDAASTDCDADNYIEPAQWTAATVAGSFPAGGGRLPTTLGLPLNDPWGTPYGYCAWDTGAENDPSAEGEDAANCPEDANRLQGSATPMAGAAGLQTALAVISAGPDRHFDTTCKTYDAAVADTTNAQVVTAAGKDDLVVRYTYSAAALAAGAVWKLDVPSSGAVTRAADQSLEVGDAANYNAPTGAVSALAFTTEGMIRAGGGLHLADETQVLDAECMNGFEGALRYNAAGDAVQFCAGPAPSWTDVGSGGAPSGSGQTDVNGIDVLRDGIAEYSSLNVTGLGYGALCKYGRAAGGSQLYSDMGGCTTNTGTGLRNTAVGVSAGAAISSGSDNTGFGYQSLYATTTGSNNTGFGSLSLRDNTQGNRQTAAGKGALTAANTGSSSSIALRDSTYGDTDISGDCEVLSVPTPSGVVAGDLLIYAINSDDTDGTTFDWPAGFTELHQVETGDESSQAAIAWKLADGTEGANLVAHIDYQNCWTTRGAVAAYSGVSASSPIIASSASAGGPNGPGPYTKTCSVVTDTAGAQLVWFAAIDAWDTGAKSLTPAAGHTLREQHTTGWEPFFLTDGPFPGSGATGPIGGTITASGNNGVACMLVALRPASGGTVYAEGNTAAGYQGLAAVSSGSFNTAAGHEALKALNMGNRNTAAGYQALLANTSGHDNAAAGRKALAAYAGSGATAAGNEAMVAATGNNNTALGNQALWGLIGGLRNTAFGEAAGAGLVSDSDNVALGMISMRYASGSSNVLVGAWTGKDLETDGNVGIGGYALSNAHESQNIVAIGHQAMEQLDHNGCYPDCEFDDTTAIGYRALATVDGGGQWNAALGYQALENAGDDAPGNVYEAVAVGYRAARYADPDQRGRFTVVGNRAMESLENIYCCLTVVGSEAAMSMTDDPAASMTIFGAEAMKNADDTIAVGVAYGHQAGGALTTGDRIWSTFVGSKAWSHATADITDVNAALGYRAGRGCGGPDGGWALAVGYNALSGAVTQGECHDIAAIGANAAARGSALYHAGIAFGAGAQENALQGGHMWTASVGYQAGRSRNVESSYAIGWRAWTAGTTGEWNMAIGSEALLSATVGDHNVGFGHRALKSVTDGDKNIAIGALALEISTDSYNTAIGYRALALNTAGTSNTALGVEALGANTTGDQNTALGHNALSVNTTGSNNVALGYNAGPSANNLSNTVCIGNGTTTASSNTVRMGNASVTWIGGQVVWTALSDRRMKKDIQDSDLALDFISALRPVSYRRVGGNGRLDYGFIAQEVEEALKGRVTNMVAREEDAEKTYRLRPADLIAPAVKAVQQQEMAARARDAAIGGLKAEMLEIQRLIEKVSP